MGCSQRTTPSVPCPRLLCESTVNVGMGQCGMECITDLLGVDVAIWAVRRGKMLGDLRREFFGADLLHVLGHGCSSAVNGHRQPERYTIVSDSGGSRSRWCFDVCHRYFRKTCPNRKEGQGRDRRLSLHHMGNRAGILFLDSLSYTAWLSCVRGACVTVPTASRRQPYRGIEASPHAHKP